MAMIMGSDGREAKIWFARVLSLQPEWASRDNEEKWVAFVQYIEVTPPLVEVDRTLDCNIVRWSPSDGKISLFPRMSQ